MKKISGWFNGRPVFKVTRRRNNLNSAQWTLKREEWRERKKGEQREDKAFSPIRIRDPVSVRSRFLTPRTLITVWKKKKREISFRRAFVRVKPHGRRNYVTSLSLFLFFFSFFFCQLSSLLLEIERYLHNSVDGEIPGQKNGKSDGARRKESIIRGNLYRGEFWCF